MDAVRRPEATAKEGARALLAPRTVRAMERDYKDLALSVHALAVLMRESGPDSVLARVLNAELAQMAAIGGEILTALRVQSGDVDPPEVVELAGTLEAVARDAGRPLRIDGAPTVRARAPHALVRQVLVSILAYAHRAAEGIVAARVSSRERSAVVQFRVPVGDTDAPDERLDLLHGIVRAGGGRMVVEHARRTVSIRVAFPLAAGERG